MSIYEIRRYTVKPGTIGKQLEMYYELGYKVQIEHLGEPVIYTKTEVGDVNTYVHIWKYEDLTERTMKRLKLEADPQWTEYKEMSSKMGYQLSQENSILVDAFK
jgi:hypothetical protein